MRMLIEEVELGVEEGLAAPVHYVLADLLNRARAVYRRAAVHSVYPRSYINPPTASALANEAVYKSKKVQKFSF